LHLIFDLDAQISVDDLTDSFDLNEYFTTLCLPGKNFDVPKIKISEKYTQLEFSAWEFQAKAFGLREKLDMDRPDRVAQSLIDSGERNLLLLGPPRTGKSHLALDIAAEYLSVDRSQLHTDSRFSRVQFHQSWSYGDFIRKIVPVPTIDGNLSFARANGKFLDHCSKNAKNRSVFLIEEINRASLSSVFGEAFQVIEVGYRGTAIELPGSLPDDAITDLVVPVELLLIATANDLDKSTLPLDFALLGRFSVVECPVVHEEIYSILMSTPGWSQATAESLMLLVHEVEGITSYPIGHAFFYKFCTPVQLHSWYRTTLRPSLSLFLTKYRTEELARVDALFKEWGQ
jgi:5-methylcytosine-specific restriction protein B